jgi:hypothetical protein
MARKSNAAAQVAESHETPNISLHTESNVDPEAPADFIPPARENNDASEIVLAAASTITGCSEAEVKNYVATMDFVSRQLAIKFADKWKAICKIAQAARGDDEAAPAKSTLGVKIDIDHTNINMMDTKVTFKVKPNAIEASVDKQENLLQVQFSLS